MTEPDVIHDEILLPHGTHPNEVMRRALAQAQAKANLQEGESIEDLQLGTGVGTGPTSPLVKWRFSYQILRPGGSVTGRWR
jgi:hypothetical protein